MLGLLMAAVFLIGLLGAFGASYPVSIFVQDVLHLNQPEDSTLDEFVTGFLSIVSCGLAFHLTIALCVPLLRVLGLLDAPTARFLAVRSAYFRVTFGLCAKHYRVTMSNGEAAEADASDVPVRKLQLEALVRRSQATWLCFGTAVTVLTTYGGALGYLDWLGWHSSRTN